MYKLLPMLFSLREAVQPVLESTQKKFCADFTSFLGLQPMLHTVSQDFNIILVFLEIYLQFSASIVHATCNYSKTYLLFLLFLLLLKKLPACHLHLQNYICLRLLRFSRSVIFWEKNFTVHGSFVVEYFIQFANN